MRIGLREFTLFALLLGIVAAAGWFVFLPHWRHVADIDRENQAKQSKLTQLAQLDRLGQTSESLTKELDELGKALEFFESKLPDNQQIHAVLREITQIREKHKLNARTVKALKQEESDDYIAIPIEMELEGTFEGFYRFILDLERLPRITRISDMEVVKDQKQEGQVSTKLVVAVYFEPGGKGAAPIITTPSSRGRGRG